MLSCLKPLPPPPSANNYLSSPASQGYSTDNTPASSVQLSPTVNLTREYTLALHTHSYGEIRRIFSHNPFFDQNLETGYLNVFEEPQLLDELLQPSHESIQEALAPIRPNPRTYLVAKYFEQSENTFRLCLHLYQNVHHARILYTPIHNVLDGLPLEFDSDSYSLAPNQCKLAFDSFLPFENLVNPFFSPDSDSFNEIRGCFSLLRDQLDDHLKKSRSKIHQMRCWSTGSGLCLIVTAVGVAVSAVAIATHALIVLAATSICPGILPNTGVTKKEMVHLAQLDAAAKGAYVLHNHLDTIDRLVARLHSAVENDKLLIQLGLGRGMDRFSIQEILKQLRRNRPSFIQQLVDLEEHLFLCFAAINRARSLLLQEILMHHQSV